MPSPAFPFSGDCADAVPWAGPAGAQRSALAASVFEYTRDGIMIAGLDGSILAVNAAFTSITGWAEHEVLGRNPRLLKSGRQDSAFYRGMWDTILQQGWWQGEAWNRRKDGSHFAERITITTVPDQAGRPHHYIAVFADITKASEQRKLLEQRSHFDALTGLPNRLLLQERLERALGRARADRRQVALAFIDLDGFKGINDDLGHLAGDEVLVMMASRLQKALRESDTLARFGGDEFVAVLTDVQDQAMLSNLITRLMAAAREPLMLAQRTVRLSASVGVSLFPRDGDTAQALLRRADEAMYAAKRAGRDCARMGPSADPLTAPDQEAQGRYGEDAY
ncbi:MAG: sensor-containing diguanylate cyclase/phosphodiesterase [Massilia sp.]|nr:sensor-containing diguanylate cyclase/phosphodiesterase [Massilia sp.]